MKSQKKMEFSQWKVIWLVIDFFPDFFPWLLHDFCSQKNGFQSMESHLTCHWLFSWLFPWLLQSKKMDFSQWKVNKKSNDFFLTSFFTESHLWSLPVVCGFFARFACSIDLVETWVLVDEKVHLLYPSDMWHMPDSPKFRSYQMCWCWLSMTQHIHNIFAYKTVLCRCIGSSRWLQWTLIFFSQPMGIVCQPLGLWMTHVRCHCDVRWKVVIQREKSIQEYKQ